MPDTTDAPENGNRTEDDAAKPIASLQRTLGLLFTPVSIIALLCNVLGLSGQNTAIISLASILLTAIILYRGFINRLVPSSLLCGLIIGLTAVFTANYEHILFKDTGLVRYFHASNDFLGQNGQFFDKAKKEIWFVGLDFHITAGDRKQLLLKKLSEGVKVRFLIFNPDSPFLPILAQDFDQTPQALTSECLDSTQGIIALRNDWLQHTESQKYSDGLEIRLFDEVPHARMYIVDPDDTRARSFYIPYMNKENSPALPGYLLTNITDGVVQQYMPGVRKLWSSAQPIEVYEHNHRG